jgi:hypothetical protein
MTGFPPPGEEPGFYPQHPGNPQYPQYAQYPQYPGYPPAPYGYPPPPYGYPPPGNGRPGVTIAAAVLGYVAAGLLILAGLLLFLGASVVHDFDSASGASHDSYVAEFVLLGFANLLAAGLLIAGSVSMTGRHPTGRTLFSVGAGIVLASAVYWLARWAPRTDSDGALIFYDLLFVALVIVGMSLAWTSAVTAWLRGTPRPR